MKAFIVTIPNHCPDPSCPCDWRGYVLGRTVGHGGRGEDLRRRLIDAGKAAEMWLWFVDTAEGRAFMERQQRRRENAR